MINRIINKKYKLFLNPGFKAISVILFYFMSLFFYMNYKNKTFRIFTVVIFFFIKNIPKVFNIAMVNNIDSKDLYLFLTSSNSTAILFGQIWTSDLKIDIINFWQRYNIIVILMLSKCWNFLLCQSAFC